MPCSSAPQPRCAPLILIHDSRAKQERSYINQQVIPIGIIDIGIHGEQPTSVRARRMVTTCHRCIRHGCSHHCPLCPPCPPLRWLLCIHVVPCQAQSVFLPNAVLDAIFLRRMAVCDACDLRLLFCHSIGTNHYQSRRLACPRARYSTSGKPPQFHICISRCIFLCVLVLVLRRGSVGNTDDAYAVVRLLAVIPWFAFIMAVAAGAVLQLAAGRDTSASSIEQDRKPDRVGQITQA
jgi:hypothetical protein